MGDRGNIYIRQSEAPDTGLYLYTHWGGEDLPLLVQSALRRGQGRWDDEPYLARILFCELVQDDVLGLEHFGISTYLTDNEHPIVVVDSEQLRVGFASPGREPDCYISWSFGKFLEMDESALLEQYQREDAE